MGWPSCSNTAPSSVLEASVWIMCSLLLSKSAKTGSVF